MKLLKMCTTAIHAQTIYEDYNGTSAVLKLETICPKTAICPFDKPYTAGYARYLVGLKVTPCQPLKPYAAGCRSQGIMNRPRANLSKRRATG